MLQADNDQRECFSSLKDIASALKNASEPRHGWLRLDMIKITEIHKANEPEWADNPVIEMEYLSCVCKIRQAILTDNGDI